MLDAINVKGGVRSVCHLPVAVLKLSESTHSLIVGLMNEIMSFQGVLD